MSRHLERFDSFLAEETDNLPVWGKKDEKVQACRRWCTLMAVAQSIHRLERPRFGSNKLIALAAQETSDEGTGTLGPEMAGRAFPQAVPETREMVVTC